MIVSPNRLLRALAPGLAIVALIALSHSAAAQVTAEQQSAMRASCRSDFRSKCSGVTPGGKEALTCLQKNVASLSPACKTAVSATIQAPAPAAAKTEPTPVAPAAATAAAPPAPEPAAKSANAPPAAAPPVRQAAPKPAQLHKPAAPTRAAVAAPAPVAPPAEPPAPPAAAPSRSALQTPFVPGAALIVKACARFLIMHCRGIEPGGGREVACLTNAKNAGKFIGPRCQAALKLTAPLR